MAEQKFLHEGVKYSAKMRAEYGDSVGTASMPRTGSAAPSGYPYPKMTGGGLGGTARLEKARAYGGKPDTKKFFG